MSADHPGEPIAVIGMGCWYPGAPDLRQLWENVLAGRREFRPFPSCRLPLTEYGDLDPTATDKTYVRRGAFVDGFHFDWAARRIPERTVKTTDIAHWLALEVALQAIEHAGLDRRSIPKEKTSVIVGNSLTGEQSRAFTLRLRWPYVRRALRAAATARLLSEPQTAALEATMEQYYKSVFPEMTEDSLAGGMSNTIAGRICNYLDLHGGGFVVDGACASSLIAVATAAQALEDGRADLALAGGVDISLDTMEIIGFSRVGALTREDMTVYDRRASGFMPGEGSGFVLLKRLVDARRDRNPVYAVIRGWGLSSDGRGGLTAPTSSGQALALKRAYERAGYGPNALRFIEGHGTGTRVGDRTELEAIAQVLAGEGNGASRRVGVTSVKSNFGHTKAAAGAAGFIKAVLAVNRRVVPPIAHCRDPSPVFEKGVAIYPIIQGELEPPTAILRAGVSAFGFGGINCHLTLESADPPSPQLNPTIEERALLASNQETELFVFAAPTLEALLQRIGDARRMAEGTSFAEAADLSASLTRALGSPAPLRAAVVAAPGELLAKLDQLERAVRTAAPDEGILWRGPGDELFLGNRVRSPRLGFLFPGQGSQQLNSARSLVERHAWARELVESADAWASGVLPGKLSDASFRSIQRSRDPAELAEWAAALSRTEVAQPTIVLGSLLFCRQLDRLGIRPDAVAGHSLGELTAFQRAGAFDEQSLITFAALRGRAMATRAGEAAGSMASLGCTRERVESLIAAAGGYVVVANLNAPSQVVISGEAAAVAEVVKRATAEGIVARTLAVSEAFHSRLVEKAAERIRSEAPIPASLAGVSVPLFTTMRDGDVRPEMDLKAHFARQVLSEVDFVGAVRRMSEVCDLFLEVGPGGVLTGLVNAILGGSQARCFPTESRPGRDRDLNVILGLLHTSGVDIQWAALFEKRLVRPFTPPSARAFIESPCERPFPALKVMDGVAEAPIAPAGLAEGLGLTEEALNGYLKERKGFIADVIAADLKAMGRARLAPPAAASTPKGPTLVAASPSPPGADDIERFLQETAAARTGFPAESIHLESRLLDDLNLDSIKAGELVAAIAVKFGVSGQLDPSKLANATLQSVADTIRTALGMPNVDAPTHGKDLALRLRELAAEVTGFPLDQISYESRLLDDLNLDSIKAAEWVARALKIVGAEGRLDPSRYANATIAEVADALRSVSAPAPGAALAPRADALSTVVELAREIVGLRVGQLSPDAHPVRDLGLDGEKVWKLFQNAADRLGIEPAVDRAPLEDRSLRQLAQILEGVAARHASSADRLDNGAAPVWVRPFAERLESREPPPPFGVQRESDRWDEASVLILAEPAEAELADALGAECLERGARVERVQFADPRTEQLARSTSLSHLVAILPRSSAQWPDASSLMDAVTHLRAPAQLPLAAGAPRRWTTAAFIQLGGGHFGLSSSGDGPLLDSARAFAASLHLERSDLRVRALDVSPAAAPRELARRVINELMSASPYAAVAYDGFLHRYEPEPCLEQPCTWQPRPLSWTKEDVILITGGARGITAECALALGSLTGARLALVGNMEPSSGAAQGVAGEISATLNRATAKGITARYYACNVTDRSAVFGLVRRVEGELGPVTGVVHGAGLNHPARLPGPSAAAATAEVSPKLLGAIHLAEALQHRPPKLFAALTSIIGVTGMPGNGWYGYSNECLDLVLRRFAQRHPESQVQSIAYSIWGEVGMGVRLGAVHQLGRAGVNAISTAEGVRRFLELWAHDPGHRQVIVTGGMSGFDTWRSTVPEPPAGWRFLERIIRNEPGVELVARCHLTLERDLFLRDHVIRGSYLLPTVFGLEAMAQAVAAVTGRRGFQSLRIEDLILKRPIVADPSAGAQMEIRCEVLEKDRAEAPIRVKVGIGMEQTGFRVDHFSALFVIPQSSEEPQEPLSLPAEPLGIHPRDLYAEVLFHGPSYQRIRAVHQLQREECRCTVEAMDLQVAGEASFRGGGALLLGDPFAQDAILQCAMLVNAPALSLPTRCQTIELFNLDRPHAGTRRVRLHARQEDVAGHLWRGGAVCVDQEGRVIARWTDCDARVVDPRAGLPSVAELAAPAASLGRRLQERLAAVGKRFQLQAPGLALGWAPNLSQLAPSERRDKELPLVRSALQALDPAIDLGATGLTTAEGGRPLLTGALSEFGVSISHDSDVCLCVVGNGAQGCDVEPVVPRESQAWRALLGPRGPLMDDLLARGEGRDVAGTCVWTAMEALKKATGADDIALELLDHDGDVSRFAPASGQRSLQVITLHVPALIGAARVVALVMHAETAASSPKEPRYDVMSSKGVQQPDGRRLVALSFPVSFKEASGPGGAVYFSHFAQWMGRARELALRPVFHEISRDLGSGQWGFVTQASLIEFSRLLGPNDLVELLCTPSRQGEGTIIQLDFEFNAVNSSGRSERVARAAMTTSWARATSPGRFEPAPLPAYLEQLLGPSATSSRTASAADPSPGPELAGARRHAAGRAVDPVFEASFDTSLEDSNIAGNIYFSNYYTWQGRIRDRFFRQLTPALLDGTGGGLELFCRRSRVRHLRTAMPFDRIHIQMRVGEILQNGLRLAFDYFRELPGGGREKIASGEQELICATRSEGGAVTSADLPADCVERLTKSDWESFPTAVALSPAVSRPATAPRLGEGTSSGGSPTDVLPNALERKP